MSEKNEDVALGEREKRLVAIGASGAVNCRPCLEFHMPLEIKAGLSESEIRQAIEIGFGVIRDVHAKTRGVIDEVISNMEHTKQTLECCDAETAEEIGCC